VSQPVPKPVRFTNSQVTKKARTRDGVCLYGIWHKDGCQGGLEGHHIIPVGVGGPDVIENVITLCSWHHKLAEARKIDPDEFRTLLSRYHGYRYDKLGRPIVSDVRKSIGDLHEPRFICTDRAS
jgi:hypothetical protein